MFVMFFFHVLVAEWPLWYKC